MQEWLGLYVCTWRGGYKASSIEHVDDVVVVGSISNAVYGSVCQLVGDDELSDVVVDGLSVTLLNDE